MTLCPTCHNNELTIIQSSIIQDCEDALTSWVESKASVKPTLSTRARTLSQRRKNKMGPQDLSHQDTPMQGDRDSWVNAHEHGQNGEEEYEEEEEGEGRGGQQRGRQEAAAEA